MAQTGLGLVVGTVFYMSPEQALNREVDSRSDLFSLGIVLYESLAGRLPFEGDTQTAIVDRLVHHEPTPLSRLNYEVPARLEDTIRKLLQKEPGAREPRPTRTSTRCEKTRRSLACCGAPLPSAERRRQAAWYP